MKRLLILLALFISLSEIYSQSQYMQTNVRYNVNDCQYEVYMRSTEDLPFFFMGGSQVTVVLPSGLVTQASFDVTGSFEPMDNLWNDTGLGTSGGFDFITVDNNGGWVIGFASPLTQGEELLLFTFSLPAVCIDEVRLWEAGDPSNIGPSDYMTNISNGFSAEEVWLDNWGDPVSFEPTPIPASECTTDQISLFANTPLDYPACFLPLEYSWTGPNGYTSTDENPVIPTTGWTIAQFAAAEGTYTVVVTDGYGCTAEGQTVVDCGELPIELLSFDAIKSGETAVTSWVTLNEIDNDYFEIERSTDGKDFYTLSEKITGAGTSVDKNSYSWIDVRPAIGINYYRLKQIDFDGGHTYSSVKSLYFDGKDIRMSLYPNPARNAVTLTTGQKKGEVTLLIFDPKGQAVFTEDYEPGDWKTSTQLDIQDMVEGMYMIKLIEGNKTETARFVKVN